MSSSDLKSRLSMLETLALRGEPIRALRKKFTRLATGYVVGVKKMESRHILRAVRNDPGTMISNVSRLSYPPSHKARLGRLNVQGEPILYAADSLHTAVKEIEPSAGDVVTILEASHRANLQLPNAVVIGDLYHVEKNRKPLLGRGSFVDPRALRGIKGDQKYEKSLEIDRKTAHWFTSDGVELYPLTNAIAQFFFSMPGLDALVFPSTAFSGGFNIAMLPKSFDKLFLPLSATTMLVTNPAAHVGEEKGVVIGRSEHISADGTIDWKSSSRATA
jgi:RES domain